MIIPPTFKRRNNNVLSSKKQKNLRRTTHGGYQLLVVAYCTLPFYVPKVPSTPRPLQTNGSARGRERS